MPPVNNYSLLVLTESQKIVVFQQFLELLEIYKNFEIYRILRKSTWNIPKKVYKMV